MKTRRIVSSYLVLKYLGFYAQVHYTGRLSDGKVFDSGDISFHFGKGQVNSRADARIGKRRPWKTSLHALLGLARQEHR